MAERLNRQSVAEKAIIHDAPALPEPHRVDRSFELPTVLYGLTACGYLGFLGLMALMLGNPDLALPMAVFFFFIAMAGGVCAQWVRMKPANPNRALGWYRFQRDGIMTATGRLDARDATIQVLLLPVVILCWGIAGATILAIYS